MDHRRRWRLLAVILAVALTAAACSDDGTTAVTELSEQEPTEESTVDSPQDADGDDDASTNGENENGTDAEEPSEEADDAEPAEAASGDPILLHSILDESEATGQSFPFTRAALEAAELYINENGGLGGSGRPIDIEICVGEMDPNINQECGQSVIDDGAIATVGSAICANDTAYPPLNEASIPNIGPLSCLESTWASPNTFLMNHGFQGTAGLQATLACTILESGTTVFTGVNVPSIVGSIPVYNQVLEAQGCDPLAGEPLTELDTSDFAPIAAQWADADVVLFSNAPPQSAPLINTATAADIDATLVFTPPTMSSATLDATEGSNEGVMAIRYYRAPDDSVEGYQVYREYLQRVDGEQFIADEFGTAAWVSVLALDQAYRDCDSCEFTPSGALDAMNELSGFDAMGIAPPLDFTADPAPQFAERFPRILTTQGFAGIVESGEIVAFNDNEPIGG